MDSRLILSLPSTIIHCHYICFKNSICYLQPQTVQYPELNNYNRRLYIHITVAKERLLYTKPWSPIVKTVQIQQKTRV